MVEALHLGSATLHPHFRHHIRLVPSVLPCDPPKGQWEPRVKPRCWKANTWLAYNGFWTGKSPRDRIPTRTEQRVSLVS